MFSAMISVWLPFLSAQEETLCPSKQLGAHERGVLVAADRSGTQRVNRCLSIHKEQGSKWATWAPSQPIDLVVVPLGGLWLELA